MLIGKNYSYVGQRDNRLLLHVVYVIIIIITLVA